MSILRQLSVIFSLFLTLFVNHFLAAQMIYEARPLLLEECLLPEDHPLQIPLRNLFRNPDLFDSRRNFRQGGFHVFSRMHRGLMVASHPHLKGILIKKFYNKVPQSHQLDNFIKRVSGARALKNFIEVNHLQHITVPQKWLYPLPRRFNDPHTKERTYILIVEKMDIVPGGKNPHGEAAKKYHQMDLSILRELCTVVYYFRGLDSMIDNMPFTYQNQIAFIDTEKWELKRNVEFLHQTHRYLSADRKQYASEVFQELQLLDPR